MQHLGGMEGSCSSLSRQLRALPPAPGQKLSLEVTQVPAGTCHQFQWRDRMWREGWCPMGLGAEPQGAGSQCSCPRPRAEGWQWDRAGGRELLCHESPTPCAAGASCQLPCPDVLPAAGPWQQAAGQPSTGISRGSNLLPPGPAAGQHSQGPPRRAAPCWLHCPGDAGLSHLSEGWRAWCRPRSGCTAIASSSQKGRAQERS